MFGLNRSGRALDRLHQVPAWRVLWVAGLATTLLLGAAAPAVMAGKPSREPLIYPPTIDIAAGDSCDFAVRIDVLVNGEWNTTFTGPKGVRTHTSGRLIVRVNNVETGANVTLNISGPGLYVPHDDGTATSYFYGSGLTWFPGTLAVFNGPATLELAPDGSTISFGGVHGPLRDLCVELG